MYAPDPATYVSGDGSGRIVSPRDVGNLHAGAGYAGDGSHHHGALHHGSGIQPQHQELLSSGIGGGMAASIPMKKRSLDNGDFDRDGLTQSMKRHQIDGQATRVLLLRNLSRGVTEVDVASFVAPFTKTPPRIYLHASAGHAFVEFADEETATAALQYFQQHPIMLKGANVMVSYSKRDAVTTLEEKKEAFCCVLASVTNLYYHVNIDLMHHLFSRHGQVEKIITFSKTPTMYQALIQFKHPEQAKEAMVALHNRNIYDGCNTLQIQPSRLQELMVKQNNSRSWDYTVNASGPPLSANGDEADGRTALRIYNSPVPFPGIQSGVPGTGPVPGAAAINRYYPQQQPVMAMGTSGGHANAMMKALERLPKELRKLNLEKANPSQTPVVICFNLPATVSIDKRIKILRDKPDTALVQYSDPLYAIIAENLLQKVLVMGNELQVFLSKKTEVKMPASSGENGEEERRTQAFSQKEQRYGGDDVEKYMRGICKPTKTLFIANIAEEVGDDQLSKLFGQFGVVKKFQFRTPKSEGSKTQTAILEMDTEADATLALMHLHNYELSGRTLKVAFSKTIIP